MRGQMIDIGGRRLRAVPAGPADAAPLVVLEHGAFGCAADWAVVQARLSARGLRSLAYDRAGMGLSDPSPDGRRNGGAAVDLDALLDALGETEPFVLVGHSMGGLFIRHYALTHPERVLGLVMVDAMTPEVIGRPAGVQAIGTFAAVLRLAAVSARFGLMRPVALVTHDLIGLEGEAKTEKRRIHGSARHAHGSADEVAAWQAISALAGAGELPPDLPVAVITAGPPRRRAWLKALQTAPAERSRHGRVEAVAASTHASVLGRRFADPVVRGVDHVLKAQDL